MITGSLLLAAINLNTPGRYLHWSIFTVSEANLALIAVMVVIFGAALVIPFPGRSRGGASGATRRGAAPKITTITAMAPNGFGDGKDRHAGTPGVSG